LERVFYFIPMSVFEKHHIYFLNDQLTALKDFLAKSKYSKIAILTDENTQKYCYPVIKEILPAHTVIEIKSGEEQKNLQTCTLIWQKLTDLEFDRKGLLINLGGGVIGDMGGFCAATYKRGIDFIQIPSTLLSQVDASVGGKLGIDFNSFKNHIGIFQEPNAVFIYSGFLKTLHKQELRSGYAEIIKHCLIRDVAKWNEIKKITLDNLYALNFDVNEIINHSVEIKAKVVAEDPTEKGLRKILNFGHTLGHAIETFFLPTKRKLLHGEAIAVGMICEAFLSVKKGNITKQELADIETYIVSIYGRPEIKPEEIEKIIPLTLQDKKNSHGNVKFSLLNKVGDCGFDFDISATEMKEALDYHIHV
jgi:3-dehydroquinate synthase